MRAAGYEPDPWQEDFLTSSAHERVLCCGRQVGKSHAIAALALYLSVTIPHHLTIVVAQREKAALELIEGKFAPMYDRIDERLLPARRDSRAEAHRTTRFSNGSRIEVVTTSATGVRSFSDPGLLIIDEAAYVPDALYHAVSPMQARSHGIRVLSSSCGDPSGFFYEANVRLADNPSDASKLWTVRSDECPWITPEFLAKERQRMPEWQYQREYECVFAPAIAVAGMVYPWFNEVTHVGDPPEQFVRVHGGVDWNFAKPGALVVIGEAEDGVAWVIHEVYEAERGIDWWAEQMKDAQRRFGVSMWHCDPSNPGNIARIKAEPLPAKKGENAIKPGLEAVSARGKEGMLKVARHCRSWLGEMWCYMLKRNADGTYRADDPDKDRCADHLMDATRYAVMGMDFPKYTPINPKPKRPRGW